MRTIHSKGLVTVPALLVALALASCSADEPGTATDPGSTSSNDEGSGSEAPTTGDLETLPTGTEELCGDQPIKIAHVDGYGANSWRKIVRAELLAEIEPCDNVTVDYSDAGGDVAKFQTAVNTYVAQGYDAIVVFDDFGEQGLAPLRNAVQAGVAVVPYVGEPGGTPGTDYTTFIAEDKPKVGDDWANWFGDVLGNEGDLIFVGGVPGNTSSPAFMNPFKASAEALGFNFLIPDPVDTNWDPGQEQRVMAGLISKYPDGIDGIASDYGVASVGGIRAFINANADHPPLATNASDNELVCMTPDLQKRWPDFEVFSLDGSTRVVRWAVRRALATVNEIELSDPTVFQLYPYIDTANDLLPDCAPDLPPDADLSSALSPEELTALFE